MERIKRLIFIFILLSCNGSRAKAQYGCDNNAVVTAYDLAIFANDGNIAVIRFEKVYDGEGEYAFNGKWGMIDTSGRVIVDGTTTGLIPSIDNLGYMQFHNSAGYACFEREGSELYGILDKDYKELIPPIYKELDLFGEYALGKDVAQPGRVILHLPSEKIVGHVDDAYMVNDISEDRVWVKINTADVDLYDSESYILDLEGNVVISPDKIGENMILTGFQEGRAIIRSEEGGLGFIDKDGNIVIPPDYSFDDGFIDLYDEMFHNGRAILRKDNKQGVIDKNGNVVIPFNYNYIAWDDESGYENFIVEEKYGDGKYLLFDYNGKMVGDYSRDTNAGLDGWRWFRDENTQREGYKDREGKVMLPPIYSDASPFRNGYALVGIENEGICLIDTKGNIILRRLASGNQRVLP